jgi:hypothetical protein
VGIRAHVLRMKLITDTGPMQVLISTSLSTRTISDRAALETLQAFFNRAPSHQHWPTSQVFNETDPLLVNPSRALPCLEHKISGVFSRLTGCLSASGAPHSW